MAGQHEGKIIVQQGSSCAIRDMSGLCYYGGRPAEALLDFTSQNFFSTAIVVFHGVVDAPEKERNNTEGWCRGCNYVQEFVAFIRENNFGEVIEGVKQENRIHLGHIVQVVTWAPNYEAIAHWKAQYNLEKQKCHSTSKE